MTVDRQLRFWKFLALLGFSLAAYVLARKARSSSTPHGTVPFGLSGTRTSHPDDLPRSVDEPTSTNAQILPLMSKDAQARASSQAEHPSASTSPFRRADNDAPIVLSIDDLDETGPSTHKWVKIPSPEAKDIDAFPVPTFNSLHHHH